MGMLSRFRTGLAQAAAIHGQLRWCLAQAIATGPWALGLLLVMTVCEALAPAVGIRVTQRLVNLVVTIAGQGPGGLATILAPMALFLLTLIVTRGPMWQFRGPVEQRLRDRLTARLEGARLQRAADLPLVAFEHSETYDHLDRSGDPGGKVWRFLAAALGLLQGIIAAITVALLFVPVSPWIPVVLLVLLVPQGLHEAAVNVRWNDFTYERTEPIRRVDYIDRLLTGRDEQKELRVFGLAGALGQRWRAARALLRHDLLRQKLQLQLAGLGGTVLGPAISVALGVLLAMRLGGHGLDAGQFVALLTGVGAVGGARGLITWQLGELQSELVPAGAVRRFLETPRPAGRGAPFAGPGLAFPRPLVDGIRCSGIVFRYPGRDHPVLDGLDLHLRPGERTALVGPNGAGKSTLVKLLLGLYRPLEGRITADGIDFAEIDPKALHQAISAAYQDHVAFELTAQESIGLGDLARIGDLEAVRAAARQGGADDFLTALPGGYATPLGHVLDGGQGLSGGQWQRIAVSRPFMRDPLLLVLDEPTAALDPQAEAEVYGRLGAMLAGRAALLVSHRLGSARLADRVVVLREGRIVEDGPHEALVVAGGAYARMWEEQAQWYR